MLSGKDHPALCVIPAVGDHLGAGRVSYPMETHAYESTNFDTLKYIPCNSPPMEGWTAKPDGVVVMHAALRATPPREGNDARKRVFRGCELRRMGWAWKELAKRFTKADPLPIIGHTIKNR
jgi:hypothetical protein